MRDSAAETFALTALGFLAADGDGLLRLLTVSGLEIEDLRTRAGEPELLAAVMDFLISDDALLARFLTAEKIGAEAVYRARRALPGVAPDS
jgi:hypothetical protein